MFSRFWRCELKEENFEVIYVGTKQEAKDLCKELLNHPEGVVFDCETANKKGLPTKDIPDIHRIVLSSYCYDERFVFVVKKNLEKYLKKWFRSKKHKKIGHNLLFDFQAIMSRGLEVNGFFGETIYMSWLENCEENDQKGFLGLKPLLKRKFNIETLDFEDVWGHVTYDKNGKKKVTYYKMMDVLENPDCEGYNRKEAIYYSALDAYGGLKLFKRQKKMLKKRGYWDTYVNVDSKFLWLLWLMEVRGIRLDMNILYDVYRKTSVHILRNQHVWDKLYPGINKNSPPQKAHLFFRHGLNEKTDNDVTCGCNEPHTYRDTELGKSTPEWPDGKPSVSEVVLERLEREGCEAARLLMLVKRHNTLRTNFVNRYLRSGEKEVCNGIEIAVAHTSWSPIIRTGRISGKKNSRGLCGTLQNVPAREKKDPYRVRRAFVARPGHVLIVVDYSQLELRIVASLSQEYEMIHAFENNIDLHSKTAKAVFNLPCELLEVKSRFKTQRNVGKTLNFGIAYGMKAFLLQYNLEAEGVEVSFEEASNFIEKWYESYPEVKRYMIDTVETCKRCGYVETISGRRRYVPNINLTRPCGKYDEFTDFERELVKKINNARNIACNTPIQGSAADILKKAQVELMMNEELREYGFHQLLQIHDEIVSEVPIKYAERALELKEEIMRSAYSEKLEVDLDVEGKIAYCWEDGK